LPSADTTTLPSATTVLAPVTEAEVVLASLTLPMTLNDTEPASAAVLATAPPTATEKIEGSDSADTRTLPAVEVTVASWMVAVVSLSIWL
jgi:hypothetical protein